MTYRDGWWHCDGEDCQARSRDLPPEWYAEQMREADGRRRLHTFCTTCLRKLKRRILTNG